MFYLQALSPSKKAGNQKSTLSLVTDSSKALCRSLQQTKADEGNCETLYKRMKSRVPHKIETCRQHVFTYKKKGETARGSMTGGR